MKKILRIFIILAVVTAVFIGGLILERRQLIDLAVTIGATNVLGAPVHLDSVSLDPSGGVIRIGGFKLYNPAGFEKRVLADIPTIDIEYAKDALAENVLHLKKITLYVRTLIVIKNKKGALNVDELRIVKDVMQIKMQIDTLVLTADEVVYEDYTKGAPPTVKGFSVNIKDKSIGNITTAEQLGTKILSEILAKTTIKRAAVIGAAAVAGIALAPPIGLPIAAAILVAGNDSVKADFAKSYDEVYQAGVTTMKRMGNLTYENKKKGAINGTVKGGKVKIRIEELRGKTHVTVSGRKIVRPNVEIANGVLFEISRELGG